MRGRGRRGLLPRLSIRRAFRNRVIASSSSKVQDEPVQHESSSLTRGSGLEIGVGQTCEGPDDLSVALDLL